MNYRVTTGVIAALSVAACVATPPPASVPPSTAIGDPPSSSNGWAGRSAGKGRFFLKCGGEDPQGVFFAYMVGSGRNARVANGVMTFTGIHGYPRNEEINIPVRRPANYMDDPRCVGPDGMGGIWMSTSPDEPVWFFILPERGRGVQVNQLLPPPIR